MKPVPPETVQKEEVVVPRMRIDKSPICTFRISVDGVRTVRHRRGLKGGGPREPVAKTP